MRRLPIALVLAAAIVLMVTVPIKYTPMPINASVERFCVATSYIMDYEIQLYYNISLPPPIVYVKIQGNGGGISITEYDSTATSWPGLAVYKVVRVNETLLVLNLARMPSGWGEDFLSFYIAVNNTRIPAYFYASTDGVNWAVVKGGRCVSIQR